MPIRFLMYLSDLYSKMTAKQNLYGTKLIRIPTPKFVVFYNGNEIRAEHEILKLSDAYMVQEEENSLELLVQVLNINVGYNEELKNACKTLSDYSLYVQSVRTHRSEGMSIEEAVELTIEECIRDDILREFLEQNRAEAKAVSIYEYNEEEHMRMEREQHYEEGKSEGLKLGMEKGLERGELIGTVKTYREFQLSDDEIIVKLMEKYGLEEDIAREYCK